MKKKNTESIAKMGAKKEVNSEGFVEKDTISLRIHS